MPATITSCALVGVDPRPVSVEAHVAGSSKNVFTIVGLPDAAVREAKERVRAAFLNSGFAFPRGRVVVNLSPADLPKAGASYDLPIALGVLDAARSLARPLPPVTAIGELALDGALRPTRGGLAAAIVAHRRGEPCILPVHAARETVGREGFDVRAAATLGGAVRAAFDRAEAEPVEAAHTVPSPPPLDLADVRGQASARRALEVAAAGGHHLLLVGAPGAGKTMLARCLPGILPPLTPVERDDVLLAASAAGIDLVDPQTPPFRSPHHSASMAALVGGGVGLPRPGEVALAHHGVLFLDELGEFSPAVLDALRQPLEDGEVHVARASGTVRFPARFQLVAATNPCPCGFRDDRLIACSCSDAMLARYRRRLSGPLLDRIDLRIRVCRLRPSELQGPAGEPSSAVSTRVAAARRRQRERGVLNRDLSRRDLDALEWTSGAVDALSRVARVVDTARSWDRIRRVARTIADLGGREAVDAGDVDAAEELRR